MENDVLIISGKEFNSRLFLGTGKFSSPDLMESSILSSKTELVTVALKRVDFTNTEDRFSALAKMPNITLMPNTSGVRTAKEAIFCAELAREALGTNWLKLEIHPDPKYLMPDPIETLNAATELVKLGFIVLPYVNADPVLCKRLEDVGVSAVMPLGAAIGSNLGLQTKHLLSIIIEQANVPVIIDAGIGVPSDACMALEMGASAVLVNTAIAVSNNPITMASAFANAVIAGRDAYVAGIPSQNKVAVPSSPLTEFLYK
jgi:thiazole synthase